MPENQQWVQGFQQQISQSPEVAQCFEQSAPGKLQHEGSSFNHILASFFFAAAAWREMPF
jgi:hypothetical protein